MQSCALAALALLLSLPTARSGCAFVQDDLMDCPLPWPTDPAGDRCVPRPAGWSEDGVNRSAELLPHTYVPFNYTYPDGTTKLIPSMCPQYADVCCTNYQM